MELNDAILKKIYHLITFAVLLYLGVRNFDVVLNCAEFIWKLLIPFVFGAGLAFVMNVPMSFIEKKLFKKSGKNKKWTDKAARPLSLIAALILVTAVILIVVFVVVPELVVTLSGVVKLIERNIPLMQRWVRETFSGNAAIVKWAGSLDIRPEKILDSITSVLKNGVGNVVNSAFSVTMGIVSTMTNFGIGFIFACYILIQKETLGRQVRKAAYALLPVETVRYLGHVCRISNRIFANFITGKCIDAVIMGVMFFVVMSITRFPYAMLVAVLIGFTALIPVFGAFIGCILSFLLILMVSPVKALAFLVMFFVIFQLEGNFIYPYIVGSSVGLPAIWVLVAVTVGGSLMGIVGMLIFIPLVSVLYTLFREWVNAMLEIKRIKIE